MSSDQANTFTAKDILERTEALNPTLDMSFRDKIVEAIYVDTEAIAGKVVSKKGKR
ncbi:MAG: hypothetical protein QGI86_04210 [Candidatus Poribacteria bacterium]|jgi:hypothetical protein|nr:hypothetical protein [Candidatus Poribacteria bacterium]MDP6745723.1 hypothetical protein [Candidatus Poribacteria bacterium]MDP6996086.1 hypothetical protein [Candidatus Poribacteria bacterium]